MTKQPETEMSVDWLIEFHALLCTMYQRMMQGTQDLHLLELIQTHKNAVEYLVKLKKAGLELVEERKRRGGGA